MMPGSTAPESGSAVLLSICVPTKDRPQLVLRNLRAVLSQIAPGDAVEILVSDNSEGPATAEAVSELVKHGALIAYSQNVPPVSMSVNHNRLIDRARGLETMVTGIRKATQGQRASSVSGDSLISVSQLV